MNKLSLEDHAHLASVACDSAQQQPGTGLDSTLGSSSDNESSAKTNERRETTHAEDEEQDDAKSTTSNHSEASSVDSYIEEWRNNLQTSERSTDQSLQSRITQLETRLDCALIAFSRALPHLRAIAELTQLTKDAVSGDTEGCTPEKRLARIKDGLSQIEEQAHLTEKRLYTYGIVYSSSPKPLVDRKFPFRKRRA